MGKIGRIRNLGSLGRALRLIGLIGALRLIGFCGVDRGATLDRVDEAMIPSPYLPYSPYRPYFPHKLHLNQRTDLLSEGVRFGLSQK